MRTLSEKYKELAQRAGRYPKLRMELYAGARGEWTDTVEQEYNGENAIVSATYTNGIITKPSRFETGLAFCGSLEIELHGVATTPFIAGKRFKLFSGFYDPDEDDTVEASVGEFFIESVSADNGKVTVKARDKMMYAEQKFNAVGMTYPCSLLDCVREIFRQMGFTMPEDYTLDINPTVWAPAWQKPNMTEGVYDVRGDGYGYFFVEDPQGYDIKMPGADKPTKGYCYSATGFALTCREALASVAKMQLGNVFIDGDGIPRFSSYKNASPLGDDRVTGLTVGEENFTIRRITYNYRGYDEESVNLFKRAVTEWRGDLMYYTNFPSDLPESYDPVRSRAVGQTFREGTIERKGLGEIEIGEFLNYTGKMGAQRFFVFGLQYEWSGGSFDETLYSFAPDYKGVDREWLNDRDLVADEDKEDEPKEEEKPETPETPESGLTIDKAVIITEADAKYLLHNFSQIEYIAGNRIGYAGAGNQIVVQGYLVYQTNYLKNGGRANGSYLYYYPHTWSKPFSTYAELSGVFYQMYGSGLNGPYKKISLSVMEVYADRITYGCPRWDENEIRSWWGVSVNNYNSWSGFGIAIEWTRIDPPGYTFSNKIFEHGCMRGHIYAVYDALVGTNTNESDLTSKYAATSHYNQGEYLIPFASLAEYEAAVGLTYEPLTLTRAEDNPTVVSGKDIGEGVT